MVGPLIMLMKRPNSALSGSLLLASFIVSLLTPDLMCQFAESGFILDSTVHHTTYNVQVGTNNRGIPIYESILVPYHGIKHHYSANGKPDVDVYYHYDFGESEVWYRESGKYYIYNVQSLPIESARYKVDSTGKQFYELERFRYDEAWNMTQKNWYLPPLGSQSIDTAIQDWGYIQIYQYTYDNSGNVLTRLDSLNWGPDEYYEYSYNNASKVTSMFHKTREPHQPDWSPTWELTEYTYGDRNQLIETILSTRLGGDWTKGSKIEYIYYPNDSLQYEVSYMWKTEGWLSFDTLEYVYEYDEADQVSSLKNRLENWEFAYFANGQVDSVFHEHFFSNQNWIEKYDVYGNLIAYKQLDPTDPSVIIYKTEYYYKGFPEDVKKEEALSLRVFPNPAGDVLQISGDLHAWEQGPAEARIFNLNGQLVQRETVSLKGESTIHVSHLSPGIYLLTVQQAHKTFRTKFVKH